jgi:hypothetical protein
MTQPGNQYPVSDDHSTAVPAHEAVTSHQQTVQDIGAAASISMLPEANVTRNAAESIAKQGFAEVAEGMNLKAPRLLTGTIKRLSNRQDSVGAYVPGEQDTISEIPESEAVTQTVEFLENYQRILADNPNANEEAVTLAGYAGDIAKNAIYLSEADIDKATQGLAAYWGDYLNEDPSHSIIAVSKDWKSTGYMANKVLGALPEALRSRVHSLGVLFDPDSVARKTDAMQFIDNTKLVMIDDWMVTGRQIDTEIKEEVMPAIGSYADAQANSQEGTAARDAFKKKIEINLAIDSASRIANGLKVNDGGSIDMQVPVRSYWKAPETLDVSFGLEGRTLDFIVTGAHSSTDDGFEIPCAKMVEILHEEFGVDAPMPPLTNIVRSYKKPM